MLNQWINRWQNGDIKFHATKFNQNLIDSWPHLKLSKGSSVFVPLCGKSLDMIWLLKQGHHVIGVELSEIAVCSFFKENNLAFEIKSIDNFTCYFNDKITIYCGDFFTLRKEFLDNVAATYDRAALVALPPDLQIRYAKHLRTILPINSQGLIIVIESTTPVNGPPYSINNEQIKQLFKDLAHIRELSKTIASDTPDHLVIKGYSQDNTYNTVYQLTWIS